MSISRLIPLLALVASLASPLAAAAQTDSAPAPAASGAPAPAYHHHHRRPSLMRALRSLNLTDAQRQQVAAIHQQEVAANAGADPQTRKANAAKMRGQIMGILNPDQRAQMQSAMHRREHRPMGAPVPAPSPAAQ